MTNKILDQTPLEEISIRPLLLHWVELLLFLIFGFLVLDSCYSFFYSPNGGIPIFFLLIYTNFRFVYSSKNAMLDYEETQDTKELSRVKKSKSRLIFICTGIFLSIIFMLIANNFSSLIYNIGDSNPDSILEWYSLSKWRNYTTLAAFILLPFLQIYYMVKTSKIFNTLVKDPVDPTTEENT